ncbi:hypothetical protein BJY04DRAFT_218549 [Aspergillus karnatakaensis]|uniref:SDR family NAD(P)-dependent oxidoreductase n=1 Tax=Aspergillus karnatakaensis TaxID=1810916 RepID=UPI003CCD9C1D
MAPPFPSATKKWHSTGYPSISPERPELSAAGKTIVITGGGTGIGAETALYFAKAGAARIALFGRREQPLLDTKARIESEAPSVEVFTAPTDVFKKDQVDAAFDSFLSAGNFKIDVLVSNAASTGPLEGVQNVDPDAFLHTVDDNIGAALYVAQAFLRYAAPNAVVIDVSSNAAHLNFGPYFAAYSIYKWAVIRLWDALGFSNPEMSVFHIQPGVVDTDMNRAAGGVKAMNYEDHVSLPAGFNLWLASPEARFLRGKYLYVNWDVDELKSRADKLEKSAELGIALVGWPFGDANWKPNANF